jgi:pilus assembly protein CpaF
MSITEITGTEGATVTMQELFRFEQRGVDASGRIVGEFLATGIRAKAMERIERYGIDVERLLESFLGAA